ncbi:PREDICTED: RNA-binding protein 25-like [Rhagoletis zephyria]|uniref:RNA-binding protein 25-like n=1 Tax=Rhagoletis zephyria TaxID=28612 RepID=UPI0008113D77|nr:PREDICTED: RNA-binding protein 25-like [Rhagoletis zephyria]
MRRRKDKITREKEVAYQRRLRDWESREKRKAKDYERESINEARIKEEEEIEKQKLKQFLQDYDDDKHDQKYYKGRNMHKRMAERRKEIVQDDCEHEQERKELEALKQKLAEEGHPDPDSEVRKRLNVAESPNSLNDQIKMLMSEARNNTLFDNDEDSHDSSSNMAVKTFGFQGMKIAAGDVAPPQHPNGSGTSTFPLEVTNDNSNHSAPMISSSDAKRKRLMVSDVFNTIEDDEANVQNGKKRRPPPNALLEDSNTDSNLSGSSNKPAVGLSSSQLSQEEKRRQVKIIIDKIPTLKEELFNYSIEWDRLDNSLMEKRIKPWINKKISDYIGEEEKTLLEFICQKLQTKCSAQCLLDNVAMVLDEEAQVFVVKLWRLLIYEIEARKIGLAK